MDDLVRRTRSRSDVAAGYVEAYRRYVWPVDRHDGVRLAPFQLLSAEGATFAARTQPWHLDVADRLVAAGATGLLQTTRRLVVDVDDYGSVAAVDAWWESFTGAGGERMVVEPLANLVPGRRRLTQPGVKVRGREYLRFIYGPDYTEPANLQRLRSCNLGHKRSLALREYALGLETLERFVAGEPI